MATLLVIVSYKIFPAHMGGQKGIVHFYEYLQQHHAIRMAVSVDNENVPTSYPVERMLFTNQRMAKNLFRLNTLRKSIKENRIDAIIAEHSYTGWIGWLLKKWSGVPFMIHSHNIEASRFRQMGKPGWKAYLNYERWIHRKADFSFFKTEEERQFALEAFSLSASKCGVIPYGINTIKKVPNAEQKLRKQFGIKNHFIFYFNGTLDYKPNTEALERLIDDINPQLKKTGIDFIILISGKNLPPQLTEKIKRAETIRYLQFVDDVELVYQASTLFLNPVINDSGVKTKLVEALANNCTVVSTRSGATGVPVSLCGEKLVLTEDRDWKAFVNGILEKTMQPASNLPEVFFTYFSWSNIAQKAAAHLQATINHG